PLILLMGTKPNKNLERTLEALKGLNCKVLIVGSLTVEQSRLVEVYQIEYENKFNLSFEDIMECYSACDFVCFASTYEGFGMPIIEAQAVGRPVITSNIGAMEEVSAGSACQVNPYDVASIKEGILKVCEDEQYRNSLISKGLENIKRFQPEYIAQQYIELYKEIID